MSVKKLPTSLIIVTTITLLVVLGFHVKTEASADPVTVLKTTGFDSNIREVLTPEQFRETRGRVPGEDALPAGGGCGCFGNK